MSDRPAATHCPYCALQCAMTLTPTDGPGAPTPVTITGRDFPTNRGGLCRKGWTSAELLRSPSRLGAPLVRGADGVLRSFDLVGMPTEFSDIIDGRENPIRVIAPRIVFDGEAGTLKAPGAFEFLEDGADGSKAGGCDLTYWLEEKRWVIGSPACLGELSLAPTADEDPVEEPPDEP